MNESTLNNTETVEVSATSVEAPQGSAAEVPESIEGNTGMKTFPIDMFPPELAAYAKALSEDTGFDVAGIATTMLSISAGIVGRSRKVRVKPGWLEQCALWSAVIAESGGGKSVVLNALMAFSNEKDIELREYREAQERIEADNRSKSAKKKDDDPMPVVERKPMPVLLTGDATWEKELMLIKDSPNGLLKTHHEMSNWFQETTKHNSDTGSYYCDLYDGQTVRQDRCERGCMVIKNALISISSMVQPAILAKHATPDRWAQGLMPRFMLVYPPENYPDYRESESEVAGSTTWYNVQRHLFDMRDELPVEIAISRSPEVDNTSAHTLFVDDYNQRQRRKSMRKDSAKAITSKAQGWVIRIAGILSLWSQILSPKYRGRNIITDGSIGYAHMRAGIALGRWFEEEAIRSSSKILEASNEQNQGSLAQWLKGKPDGVTARDLMTMDRKAYPVSEKAEAALLGLVKANLATRELYKPPKGKACMKYHPK